jgi:hypothetical protein
VAHSSSLFLVGHPASSTQSIGYLASSSIRASVTGQTSSSIPGLVYTGPSNAVSRSSSSTSSRVWSQDHRTSTYSFTPCPYPLSSRTPYSSSLPLSSSHSSSSSSSLSRPSSSFSSPSSLSRHASPSLPSSSSQTGSSRSATPSSSSSTSLLSHTSSPLSYTTTLPLPASASASTTSIYSIGSSSTNSPSSTKQVTSTPVAVVAPVSTTPVVVVVQPSSTPAAVVSSVVVPVGTSVALATPSDYASTVVYHHNIHRRNHSSPDVVNDATLAGYAATVASSCKFAHDL